MLDGFCPTQLRKQIDPMMFLHEREFADGLLGGFAADDLLAKVDGILEAARICRDQSRDKAAWDNIAFSVLDLVIEMDRRESGDRAKFELLDIWAPGPAGHRPTEPCVPVSSVNLSVALHCQRPEVESFQRAANKAWDMEPLPISHCSDYDTLEMPLQCAIKTHPDHGEKVNEARCQLAIWHAAAIAHAREIASLAEESQLPDDVFQVRWTDNQHAWDLHMTVSVSEDRTHCVRVSSHRLGTDNYNSLFRLILVLRIILRWTEDQYWPAFQTTFSKAIDRLKAST
ncbi:hypothetical protein ANO11243_029830 [Dothideomycetidae sp. 11243]|nr:hypothetical protein ANO11243_029830 [fungal sp. No.11243]